MAGVDISVCQPLAVTGGSVSNGVAYLTMSSNPITAGFVSNSTLLVSGFSGVNDSALNAGTLSNGVVTGGWTTLSVTSTQIIFNTGTSSSYSLTTSGTILQFGNSATSCAGLSSVYSNQALTSAVSQPFTSDQLGNWNVFAASGVYYVQFYAANIDTRMVQIATYFNNSSASVCTATPNSFQYDNGGNFGCTPDITFSSPHTYNFGSSGTYNFTGTLNASGTLNATNGGSFGGTFSGTPTFSGAVNFTGTPAFNFFSISSFTEITNLNANYLQGNTWAIPGAIGTGTPNTGAFSSLNVSGLSGCVNASGGTLGSTGSPCSGNVIQQFNTTSLSGNVGLTANTAATILTKSITMPSSGCPCRVQVPYSLYWASSSNGLVDAWVSDGANVFDGCEATIAFSSTHTGCEAAWVSPVTYANSANVTFTLIAESGVNSTVEAAQQVGAGPNTTMQVNVYPNSN